MLVCCPGDKCQFVLLRLTTDMTVRCHGQFTTYLTLVQQLTPCPCRIIGKRICFAIKAHKRDVVIDIVYKLFLKDLHVKLMQIINTAQWFTEVFS